MKKTLLLTGLLSFLIAAPALASESGGEAGMTHRMMMLVLQLGVILFAARLGGALFERLKLPGVLGELFSGMIVGPHLLGKLALPGFPLGLFPVEAGGFPVSAELYGICSIAAIILLFSVGLETDLKMLMRYSVAGGLVGLGGVVASLLMGAGVAMIFAPWVFGRPLGFLSPTCLFLGVISTATSVGITARILAESKKMDTPEGVTILAGAVVDDVLGIIALTLALAVTGASSHGGAIDWGHIGRVAFKAIGIWLGATVAGLVAARRIGSLLKLFGNRGSIATLALGMALVLSGLFEEAGLAMIIGAYVMGLSLSRTDLTHVVRERLEPIHSFMVPVFFCVMGMLVDFSALTSGKVIVFGLVYSAVAIAAKIIGCSGPALFFNFNWLGALRVGAGMVPRGEVALIVAGIGLAAGALTSEVFGVAILMTVITTVVAPPVLVGLIRIPRSGSRRPVSSAETDTTIRFQFPSPEAADLLLDRMVLALEADGCYVNLLDRNQRLYQVRKDSVVIGMRRNGRAIEFEAERQQESFVRTAILEVVAELESMILSLKDPIDKVAIAQGIQGDETTVSTIDLADYLTPARIQPDMHATTKEQAIDELLDLLARDGRLNNLADARQAVLAREHGLSTGLMRGIAIPHGRTDAVKRLTCAVGIRREGLDFDCIDGRPAHIMILVLSPESRPGPHMRFMAEIGRVLTEPVCREILTARTADEILSILTHRSVKRSAAV